MKWFLLLAFLVQGNNISSQPLNSEECCPCSPEDRITGNALGTDHVSSDCLCRTADSESASSMSRSSFKTSTITRPVEVKEEPKPLLNPEVGLASSVLETLREVTEQEYKDAVARDVARSALSSMEPDADADVVGKESKNVVNIILGPRDNVDMDTTPEASHNHETRCIHPSLGQESVFEQYQEQPQRKLFKHFLLTKPVASLQKNIFDMQNSPSEVQESVVTAKTSVLDNLKIKTNLLKTKLFSNNEGLTQRVEPKISFDKVFYKPVIKLPNFNLASPLDHLKKSKLFDSYISPSQTEMAKDKSLYKNVNQNENADLAPLQKPSQSRKLEVSDKLLPQLNLLASKETRKPTKNSKSFVGSDISADNSIMKPILASRDDCDLTGNSWLHTETTTEKNECLDIISLASSVPEEKSTDILTTFPSPSELIADENYTNKQDDIKMSENCVSNVNANPNPEGNFVNEDDVSDFRTSIVQPTDDITNNLSINEDSEERNGVNSENECIEPENTITRESVTGGDVLNDSIDGDNENVALMDKSESASYTDMKISTLSSIPNMKESIRNTLEDLKKVNEKWQENMKFNVHDVLNQVKIKNNIAKSSDTQSNALIENGVQKGSDFLKELVSDSDPHESNNCLAPSEDVLPNESKDNQISNSIREADNSVKTVESQDPNINEGILNKDNVDDTNECKVQQEKSSYVEPKFNSVNNEESEMEVQATEPKQKNAKIGQDNLRYIKQDVNKEPDHFNNFEGSFLRANNFFDDVHTKLSNVFSNTNENILSKFVDDAKNGARTNSRGFLQDHVLDFGKPFLNLEKNAILFKKSSEAIDTKNQNVKSFKSYLQPFKARVATPESFDIKPSVTLLHEDRREVSPKLYNLQKAVPKIYTSRKYSQNSDEKSGDERLIFKESDVGSLNTESTIFSPRVFKNNLKSPTVKNLLPSNIKDRTDEALKNIHKTLGTSLRSIPFDNDNLLETMASKRIELNEKLKSLNFDLNDRLSSLLPSFRAQPLSQSRTTSKTRSNVRSKQVLDSLRNLPFNNHAPSRSKLNTLSRKSKADLPTYKPIPKTSSVRDRLADLKSSRPTSAKAVLKSPVKSKPSYASGKTSKSGYNKDSKIITLTQSNPAKITLPRLKTIQIPEKIPSVLGNREKRPIVSKLRSGEPYTLGSENIMSRKPFNNNKVVLGKSALDTTSGESVAQTFQEKARQEVGRNLAFSNLREVLKANRFNNNVQKQKVTTNDDVIPAATETDDPKTGIMKQDVQYKCKMVCTKDK